MGGAPKRSVDEGTQVTIKYVAFDGGRLDLLCLEGVGASSATESILYRSLSLGYNTTR